ncbi:unnamed protein product [Brassicogethes aeneus]|uniref:Uncharacterized protein n=1 Tax=Brassicogethes aeneus TaxID=1431903 RepID=A0A9P0BH05_BRAAE|nr:unnamed protein product [Brassicogethes aeneus]
MKNVQVQALQEKIGLGIAAIETTITRYLENLKNPSENYIGALVDAAKIFCDVHHLISMHRRYNITPILKHEVKKMAQSTEIGEYLFGPNMQEKIKAAEALQQVGRKIKVSTYKPKTKITKRKTQPQEQPSTSKNFQRFLSTKSSEPIQGERKRSKERRKAKEIEVSTQTTEEVTVRTQAGKLALFHKN